MGKKPTAAIVIVILVIIVASFGMLSLNSESTSSGSEFIDKYDSKNALKPETKNLNENLNQNQNNQKKIDMKKENKEISTLDPKRIEKNSNATADVDNLLIQAKPENTKNEKPKVEANALKLKLANTKSSSSASPDDNEIAESQNKSFSATKNTSDGNSSEYADIENILFTEAPLTARSDAKELESSVPLKDITTGVEPINLVPNEMKAEPTANITENTDSALLINQNDAANQIIAQSEKFK